ncbi:hypothetical protein RND81_06G143300 [Saponaria officinalis]|uniref:Uncharacterized protein n=1 Tax=Saponaria officinalis TaxID=3572 RepID=A0AAW1KBN9_SAPOF
MHAHVTYSARTVRTDLICISHCPLLVCYRRLALDSPTLQRGILCYYVLISPCIPKCTKHRTKCYSTCRSNLSNISIIPYYGVHYMIYITGIFTAVSFISTVYNKMSVCKQCNIMDYTLY